MANLMLGMFSLLPLLLITGVLVSGLTLGTTLTLSRSFRHLPPWMWIPPISLTGFLIPEQSVYTIGITISAILILIGGSMFHLLLRALLSRDPHAPGTTLSRNANVFAYAFLVVSCLGAIVQAIVPLQGDILNAMHGNELLNTDSKIHQAGIALFWLCLIVHTAVTILVINRSGSLTLLKKEAGWALKLRNLLFFLSMITQLGSTLAQPTLPAPLSTVELYFHISSILQWVSTITLLLIVSTYAFDSRVLLEHLGIKVFIFGKAKTSDQRQ